MNSDESNPVALLLIFTYICLTPFAGMHAVGLWVGRWSLTGGVFGVVASLSVVALALHVSRYYKHTENYA